MDKIFIAKTEKLFDNLEGYWIGQTHSITKEIEAITDNYKTKYLKRMYALRPEDLDNKSFPDDLVIMLKRDGEYNLFYYDEASTPLSVFCNSPNGRARASLPVSREMEGLIKKMTIMVDTYGNLQIGGHAIPNHIMMGPATGKSGFDPASPDHVQKIVIAGELFAWPDRQNDRPRVFDFLTASRSPGSMADLDRINFEMYDILEINGESLLHLPYADRLELLEILFPACDNCHARIIPNVKNAPATRLKIMYQKWVVEEGNEGIVFRTSKDMLYKVKPILEVDAAIIGFVETSKDKQAKGIPSVSTLLTAIMREDGTFQELSHVGGGLTDDQRIDLFNLLTNDIVPSNYKTTAGNGRAFRFVKPKYVITMEFTDLITDLANGELVYRMALKYDPKGEVWSIIKTVPFVSLISPRFKAIRSETGLPTLPNEGTKTISYPDLRIEQITSLISVDTEIKTVKPLILETSSYLGRIVIKGRGKRKEDVILIKILLIQTNKDQVDDSYPALVVYGINYSPGRKKPIAGLISDHQEAMPFSNVVAAIKHMNKMLIEGILSKTTTVDPSTGKRSAPFLKVPYEIKRGIELHKSTSFDKSILPYLKDEANLNPKFQNLFKIK